MIDVRSLPEFKGEHYAYQPRLGRLPGSLHMPFTELFDDAGNYITKNAYLQRLPSQVYSTDCLVTYCEVGVRSCLFALLHELYTDRSSLILMAQSWSGPWIWNYQWSMMLCE